MLAKVLIPYFGQLPWWINFFLLSCSRNPRIIWTIFTDASTDNFLSTPNVIFKKIKFDDYKKIVSEKMGFDFVPLKPVKLCDIKPFLGFIHPEELIGFRYWGFGDLDVIYGNIADYLSKIKFWSVISFHDERLSGHLAFFKNNANTTRLAIHHPNWRGILDKPEYMGLVNTTCPVSYRKDFLHPSGVRGLQTPSRNHGWSGF